MFTREEKGYKNEKEKKKVKVGKPKDFGSDVIGVGGGLFSSFFCYTYILVDYIFKNRV